MELLRHLAHEGHDHTIAANTIPWWQDSLSVSVALVAGFWAMLALAHYVFKARFGVKITLAMAYLLLVGVFCYAVAPILSIVSLTLGLGLALVTVLLTLTRPSKKRN